MPAAGATNVYTSCIPFREWQLDAASDPVCAGPGRSSSAGQMAGGELFGRPNVEYRDEAFTCPVEQFLSWHRLQIVLCREVEPHDPLDLGQMRLADLAERLEQPDDFVARKPAEDILAPLSAQDEARLAQLLQMLRGVGHRHPGHGGELVDGALALREKLEEFEPRAARQRGANAGELLEEFAFWILR